MKNVKIVILSFAIALPIFILFFYFFGGKPKEYKTVNANNIYYITNPWESGEMGQKSEKFIRKYMGFYNGDIIGCAVDVLGEGSFSDLEDVAILKFKYYAKNCWGNENRESAVEFHCDEDIPKKYFNRKCFLIGTVKETNIDFLDHACDKGYASVHLTNVYFEDIPSESEKKEIEVSNSSSPMTPVIVTDQTSTSEISNVPEPQKNQFGDQEQTVAVDSIESSKTESATEADSIASKTKADSHTQKTRENADVLTATDTDTYTIVEESASFPGGQSEMYKYITKNLNYPSSAREQGVSGKCFLKFIVTPNGELKNIEVIKGVTGASECDKEAIRLVQSMPNWNPGKMNGKPVHSYNTLAVNFKIQ